MSGTLIISSIAHVGCSFHELASSAAISIKKNAKPGLDNVCVETKSFDSYFVCLFVCLFVIYLLFIIFDDISVCL